MWKLGAHLFLQMNFIFFSFLWTLFDWFRLDFALRCAHTGQSRERWETWSAWWGSGLSLPRWFVQSDGVRALLPVCRVAICSLNTRLKIYNSLLVICPDELPWQQLPSKHWERLSVSARLLVSPLSLPPFCFLAVCSCSAWLLVGRLQ